MPDNRYQIVTTSAGAVSILDRSVNEIMHNPVGPWLEAQQLYIEQSHFVDKLRTHRTKDFVLFDVGLGAATNAIAAMHAYRALAAVGPAPHLRIVSFERELSLLAFALKHVEAFDYYRGYEEAILSILRDGSWRSGSVDWVLRHGDYLDQIRDEPLRASLVFYDAYSPKVNREMWTTEAFRRTSAKMCLAEEGGSLLLTYSQATPVRVALLVAGLFVGQGVGSGLKEHTTQAATDRAHLTAPLTSQWLERWNKSQSPLPLGATLTDYDDIKKSLYSHPQFAGVAVIN